MKICTYKKGKLVAWKTGKLKTVPEVMDLAKKLSSENPGTAFICLDDKGLPFFDCLKAKDPGERE